MIGSFPGDFSSPTPPHTGGADTPPAPPTESWQRVPAFVGDGLQAVQQGTQNGHGLVGQGFGGEANEQVAIRGTSGGAQ